MEKLLELLSLIFAFLVIIFAKNEVAVKAMDDMSKQTVRVLCEKINGTYYAWIENTKEFVCQSECPNEVAKHLVKRYPPTKYELEIVEKTV